MFLFYAILINVCTHLNKGSTQTNPKMTSTSHRQLKIFPKPSLLTLFTCILTIKRWYFKYTCSTDESMEIHQVFMLWSNMLPLVYSISTSFWNLANFFRLWTKKNVQTLQKELQLMHQRHIQQNDDDKVHLVSKTMNLNNKRCNLFLKLQGHLWFMAL